ncbi:hypothetical protein [Portibacter marinus]|uniref:hypothetical protein n=1 Tax=Portibacter marinus TaxID=2898660 RepID=UPI001F38C654|nr:hypothetical protein [Portibacter marinus]
MKNYRIHIFILASLISCSGDIESSKHKEKRIVYFEEFNQVQQTDNSHYDKLWELDHGDNNLSDIIIQIAKTTDDSTSKYLLITTNFTNGKKLDSLLLPENIFESTIVTQTKESIEMQFIENSNSTVVNRAKIKILNDGILNNFIVKQEKNSDSIFYQIPPIYAYEMVEQDSTKFVFEKSEGMEKNTFSFTLNVITNLDCRIQLRHYNFKDSIIAIDTIGRSTFTIGKDYFKILISDFDPNCFEDEESININTTIE